MPINKMPSYQVLAMPLSGCRPNNIQCNKYCKATFYALVILHQ